MDKAKHPLLSNEKWTFNQPSVGFRAHYLAVEREVDDPEKEALTLEVDHTCREGVVNQTRQVFQTRLTNLAEVTAAAWNAKPQLEFTKTVSLTDPSSREKPCQLKIQWHKNYMKGWEDFPVETFLKVCDVVIGPIAVLLGPWRLEGEGWRTDPTKAERKTNGQSFVYWNGTDNWFLAHPAMAAIATGLYRQCFHLCGAGVADQVIESLSEEEVSEVMTYNSQKLALALIKKTRPWIEVPVGQNGNKINYAFPLGFWRRLMRLQRAIRRHGYEESLGQTFHEGWATVSGTQYRGVYGFWGEEGELTGHHQHLMEMGAPRRRKIGKSAKRTT